MHTCPYGLIQYIERLKSFQLIRQEFGGILWKTPATKMEAIPLKGRKQEINGFRTAELGLPELLVLSGKGNRDHYCCLLASSALRLRCPKCDNLRIRNQGTLFRDYLDVISREEDEDASVITISLQFSKYKCLSPDCGCVFYPAYSFASPYSRTTHRLEDSVVRMILRSGFSYTAVSKMLNGRLSKQVIGQIFHRRVKELETDPSEKAEWFRRLMANEYF